ncbi:G5P family DNA-binding protein [Vibrio brasiliensis]|uniref:G5P family DNA-binding protein n=1 Tax=Vibrio brasiliensis TaxID=170652 RepID=UPI001EFCFD96|nr:G5P family DNA-binding protein [Vibrio brasiliensis]MCG9753433.1 G5P family DNA-binding protein [Vibrio brasiliensis]
MKNELVIEVFKENECLDVREGVSQKTGKPWKMITQVGYAHTGGKYPVEFKIRIQDGQPFWPAGKYVLSMNSLVVGPHGDLEVGREMILLPMDSSSVKAA